MWKLRPRDIKWIVQEPKLACEVNKDSTLSLSIPHTVVLASSTSSFLEHSFSLHKLFCILYMERIDDSEEKTQIWMQHLRRKNNELNTEQLRKMYKAVMESCEHCTDSATWVRSFLSESSSPSTASLRKRQSRAKCKNVGAWDHTGKPALLEN